ncbi:hypothetical protein PybrP1_002723 [[Pythium] brassicae (nom. inval.)]|nr:hypothetical protein PybrP1_002723 [[Pythium] brassicae (nom. inval.)]
MCVVLCVPVTLELPVILPVILLCTGSHRLALVVLEEEQHLVAAGKRQERALDACMLLAQVRYERFVRRNARAVSALAVRKLAAHDAARHDRERLAVGERRVHDRLSGLVRVHAHEHGAAGEELSVRGHCVGVQVAE